MRSHRAAVSCLRLTQPLATELIEAAIGLRMLPALISRVVDTRGRHRIDPGRELPPEDAMHVLKKFPRQRFLMLNFVGPLDGRRWPNAWFEMGRMVGDGGQRLAEALSVIRADRMVFGTGMLLRYPSAPKIASGCDWTWPRGRGGEILAENLKGLLEYAGHETISCRFGNGFVSPDFGEMKMEKPVENPAAEARARRRPLSRTAPHSRAAPAAARPSRWIPAQARWRARITTCSSMPRRTRFPTTACSTSREDRVGRAPSPDAVLISRKPTARRRAGGADLAYNGVSRSEA